MLKYLLCINVRPENTPDFTKICARISRLAPDIGVIGRPGDFHEGMIPPALVHLPRLTLYLVNPPLQLDSRGYTLSVTQLSKDLQYQTFQQRGIPVPPVEPFRFGMKMDREKFGDQVVLKPVEGSFGRGIYLLHTSQAEALAQHDLPTDHPMHQTPYVVQRFVETDNGRTIYRTLVFLGEPILMFKATGGNRPWPQSDVQANLSHDIFGVQPKPHPNRRRVLVIDPEVLAFAKQVFHAHPSCPLQGIDVIRDKHTGQLYTLECNSGGNVWSFSNPNAEVLRQQHGGINGLVNQFKAWVVSADALIRATRQLAC
jgi:hypothetical protein